MNLIKVPERTKRLELTRERMKKILVETAARKAPEPAADEYDLKIADELVADMLETFDAHGLFIAYVGD